MGPVQEQIRPPAPCADRSAIPASPANGRYFDSTADYKYRHFYGGVRVFKSRYMEDQGHEYVRDTDVPLRDAILASCAAPSFFDPMPVDEYLLADGGLWANNPSILAVTEAISKFGRPLPQVHILSVGTGKPRHLYERGRFWGITTGWGRLKLVSYFLDLQSQASTNMATLLLEDRYFRMNPAIENWGLDDVRHLDALKVKADSDFTREYGEILKKIKKRSAQPRESESGPTRGSPDWLPAAHDNIPGS